MTGDVIGPGVAGGDAARPDTAVGATAGDDEPAPVRDVVLLVDAANVVGARPDGWWRDRAGAATRLLARLAALPGRVVAGSAGEPWRVGRVDVVLEGRARDAVAPQDDGLRVHRAPRDGDAEVVERAAEAGPGLVVVTADRGLRARLPGVEAVGPGWLHAVLDGDPEPGQ
ncbi:hypothetical protein [Cellulomonas sp. HD19AZ1]|uniref:hypothetical protein n=1 Tax=Cellulomonas sp. HD19AZ1 TaxID=2559593 RepID=UPI001F0F29A8|nr:hypothetical protein [Cellulomonas sp. HD19AZ1]